MTLSQIAIVLGLGFALPQVYGLVEPAGYRAALRKFPRSEPCGWVLMAIATLWMLHYLRLESNADIAKLKPLLYGLFIALGVGTCVLVRDFLAVRGLALVLMLAAKFVLDTARWHESVWRLVLITWAYVWIIAGIWWTVSPWRLRDSLERKTSTDTVVRVGSGLRLAIGLFIAILGLTVL
ncbi:MAG: hypothetical protein FJ386_10055 [Verrucomicrobia bacterium]|nr:hypothetical protein [Verrucomicrobiota bacterium]